MDLNVKFIDEDHSINKVNFAEGVGNRNLFTDFIFFKKSTVMGPFMSQNSGSITIFTHSCAWNIFFTGESLCFHSIDCLFNSGL